MQPQTFHFALTTILFASAPASRADFLHNAAGLTNPVKTITFDEVNVGKGNNVTTQYIPHGIAITPFLTYDIILNDFPPGIDGHRVGYASLLPVIPFSIKFTAPRTSAAFAVWSNLSLTKFEALLGGVVVETAETITGPNEPQFNGFANITFDEIRVTQTVLSGSKGMLVDTIQLGPAAGAACYADCDESGSLTIDDFVCFQTFFALGDPYADCDESGSLSIDDFICFQTLFAIGC